MLAFHVGYYGCYFAEVYPVSFVVCIGILVFIWDCVCDASVFVV